MVGKRTGFMTEPNSSWIDLIGYNPETGVATMVTEHGAYGFANVPENVVNAWAKAGSAGRFYHANIKGVYAEV